MRVRMVVEVSLSLLKWSIKHGKRPRRVSSIVERNIMQSYTICDLLYRISQTRMAEEQLQEKRETHRWNRVKFGRKLAARSQNSIRVRVHLAAKAQTECSSIPAVAARCPAQIVRSHNMQQAARWQHRASSVRPSVRTQLATGNNTKIRNGTLAFYHVRAIHKAECIRTKTNHTN